MDNNHHFKVWVLFIVTIIIVDLAILNYKAFSPSKADKPENPIRPQESETQTQVILPAENVCPVSCVEEFNSGLASLNNQIKNLSKQQSSAGISSKQSTVYFPLGGSVSTVLRDWSYPGGAEAYFDKKNYPGAKKISLEVFLSSAAGNARLYDATHGVVIQSSEIIANGDKTVLYTSSALNLLDGNNLLQVQFRSINGNEAKMDSSRLKIEF